MLSRFAAVRAATCRGHRHAATRTFAFLALLVISCTRTPDGINSPNDNQPASAGPPDAPRWLPVGTRVPPGQPIAFPPEPYNPQKHGPALPNPTPEANLIGKRGFIPPSPPHAFAPSRTGALRNLSDPTPSKGDRVIRLFNTTRAWYGGYAVHDIEPDLNVPPIRTFTTAEQIYIYAPTFLVPNSCIEMTTYHSRSTNDTEMANMQGWFDWCGSNTGGTPNWVIIEPVNFPSFKDHYVRTYKGKPTVALSVVTPTSRTGCWYGHLYDYQSGGWVQKVTSCGSTQIGHHQGWTAWESYNIMDSSCLTLPSIRAMEVRLADPFTNTFVPFTDYPDDYDTFFGGTGLCWTNSTYTFSFPASGLGANSWIAETGRP